MEERQLGTTHFALRFGVLATFINTLFSVVGLLIGNTLAPSVMMEPAMGLWPILFCEMVIQCMEHPDMPRGLCCLPINIPSRWYPLVLIALFSIFFGPQFSLFTGLAAGYMYVGGLLSFMEISSQTVRNWEKRFPFASRIDDPSFQQSSSALVNDGN